MGNLSSAESDSSLVDILSSPFKNEQRVAILKPNINITNTSTDNKVSTRDNDTAILLRKLVDELKDKVSPVKE